MSNQKNSTIKLKKYFPAFIASRQAAELITQKCLERLSKEEKERVILDFHKIVLVSRSFADEILDSIEKLNRRGIEMKVKNANPSVSRMLKLVKKHRGKINKT